MRIPTIQDRIRGSLVGGAVGDALGYAVEFFDEQQIVSRYGPQGLCDYAPDRHSGLALISDDTQMTLFTAAALNYGREQEKMQGEQRLPRQHAVFAYLGWLLTQQTAYTENSKIPKDMRGKVCGKLADVPELYVCRAPGNTCLSALSIRVNQIISGSLPTDYLAVAVNNSKGCGGVMRVAPLGMTGPTEDIAALGLEGAQLAAITHGHSLGYIPAAILVHIVNRLIYTPSVGLRSIVEDARDTAAAVFKDDAHIDEMTAILNAALRLSQNDAPDLENIHRLGEGWVAEETLAIAVYCALKYETDFSAAMIASVNHKGDSDSTGAVTGNILGALIGYDAIEEKWKDRLELHDLIVETADELYTAYH